MYKTTGLRRPKATVQSPLVLTNFPCWEPIYMFSRVHFNIFLLTFCELKLPTSSLSKVTVYRLEEQNLFPIRIITFLYTVRPVLGLTGSVLNRFFHVLCDHKCCDLTLYYISSVPFSWEKIHTCVTKTHWYLRVSAQISVHRTTAYEDCFMSVIFRTQLNTNIIVTWRIKMI
jgi:hypothetical protein